LIGANWEEYDTGKPSGYITHTDRQELAGLLGMPEVYHQGHAIPAAIFLIGCWIAHKETRLN